MRHRKSGRRLGRNSAHRSATMKNLTLALFRYNAVETTVPKSKELRMFAEPLITLAKKDTLANRRRAFAVLRDNEIVRKLFTQIAPTYSERPGGYTRILRLGVRNGDASPMARIELVGLGETAEAE
ncbi:MAG TPA: 50S ribosomal protein L17 [Candidatus Hydrogenedentes bacterium]|nr:50S ribosomal protein L17 [Candidatus Hydrogenedentota bacterium]HOL77763.1 50S ribosomal protein L17 [Candidatus Hydrogenedentota bacterium]HPO86423.1 50S ribosomal protein L17 [Candidatus Hydrogenedentota bacterium]